MIRLDKGPAPPYDPPFFVSLDHHLLATLSRWHPVPLAPLSRWLPLPCWQHPSPTGNTPLLLATPLSCWHPAIPLKCVLLAILIRVAIPLKLVLLVFCLQSNQSAYHWPSRTCCNVSVNPYPAGNPLKKCVASNPKDIHRDTGHKDIL